MSSVRLLPIVIAAGAALLILKSVGLVTDGGYVFSGTTAALAAGNAGSSSAGGGATSGDPVMQDGSPTITDGAPTLPLAGTAAHGKDGPHDAAAAAEAAPALETAGAACGEAVVDGHDQAVEEECAAAEAGLTPMILNGEGEEVPLTGETGDSETAVLERLGDRRGDLEAREAELDMRLALIEAAEQRIEERTAALEALEVRIEAMVEEKKSLEEEQFVAIIAMYESMKARDAAPIFDQLEMSVLLRVARAMSPRKMAPILAEMDPLKARDLTANMAIDRVEPTIELPGDFADLPQIVGQ